MVEQKDMSVPTDSGETQRCSVNVRIDVEKYAVLEKFRRVGFGMAQTERVRSDVYNEILGYGIQTFLLKGEVGERDFERIWRMFQKVNWKKINVDKVEAFVGNTSQK